MNHVEPKHSSPCAVFARLLAFRKKSSEVSHQEQEQIIMALINRIDVDGKNQVAITLRLDPETIRGLPTPQEAASPQQESPRQPIFKRRDRAVPARAERNNIN
jgi:hypothetical protein